MFCQRLLLCCLAWGTVLFVGVVLLAFHKNTLIALVKPSTNTASLTQTHSSINESVFSLMQIVKLDPNNNNNNKAIRLVDNSNETMNVVYLGGFPGYTGWIRPFTIDHSIAPHCALTPPSFIVDSQKRFVLLRDRHIEFIVRCTQAHPWTNTRQKFDAIAIGPAIVTPRDSHIHHTGEPGTYKFTMQFAEVGEYELQVILDFSNYTFAEKLRRLEGYPIHKSPFRLVVVELSKGIELEAGSSILARDDRLLPSYPQKQSQLEWCQLGKVELDCSLLDGNESSTPKNSCQEHKSANRGRWVLVKAPAKHKREFVNETDFEDSFNFRWTPYLCKFRNIATMQLSNNHWSRCVQEYKANLTAAANAATIGSQANTSTSHGKLNSKPVLILIGDSLMQGVYYHMIYTYKTFSNQWDTVLINAQEGLEVKLPIILSEIKNVLNKTSTVVVVFNSGLHDLARYCSVEPAMTKWQQQQHIKVDDCGKMYRRNMMKLITEIKSLNPFGVNVMALSTAAWHCWGNSKVQAIPDYNAYIYKSVHSVRYINQLALQAVEQVDSRIPVLDFFTTTYGRVDNAERRVGGNPVHYQSQVYDLHSQMILGVMLEHACPRTLGEIE